MQHPSVNGGGGDEGGGGGVVSRRHANEVSDHELRERYVLCLSGLFLKLAI